MKATSTKPEPFKRPSWKKLKKKLQEKAEADGPFQDGDYEESMDYLLELPTEEPE